MKRILIITNKSWELEPALSALLNSKFKPKELSLPDTIDYPRTKKQGEAYPNATWIISDKIFELWCIEQIMTPCPDIVKFPRYYSSSAQKNIDLPKIFNYSTDEIALVIAFGTAGYPSGLSKNGSVIIGSNIFIFNTHPGGTNEESKWDDERFGKLIESSVSSDMLNKLKLLLSDYSTKLFFEKRLLRPPLNSPETQEVIFDKEILALSNVNVTKYNEYNEFDEKGLNTVKITAVNKAVGSVETTHGIIRLHAEDKPFLSISSIVDRVGYFDTEVDPKDNAQNFSGAFNGGIFIGWLIPQLSNILQ
jgi:hypothetical protein